MRTLTPYLAAALTTVALSWSCGPWAASPHAVGSAADLCTYDRQQQLALGLNAFDQSGTTGWRPLYAIKGCESAAAELIRDYRAAHAKESGQDNPHFLLYFHEGQIRAELGQTAAAIELFKKATRPPEIAYGFNQFAEAHVAFLRGDLRGLTAAKKSLLALPKPADYDDLMRDQEPKVPWPMNLEGINRLLRCFGQPYKIAFRSEQCGRH